MTPKTVFVDVDLKLPKQLKKDLMENQQACETCHGLGIVVQNNPYGIKDESSHSSGIRFPYSKQAFTPCPSCYNGVQVVCNHCRKPGPRGFTDATKHCQCEGAAKQRSKELEQKEEECWDKAKKISAEEACKHFNCVYLETPERYAPPDEIEEVLQEYEHDNPGAPMPRIWGTFQTSLELPHAEVLVMDACGELHEDAMDNIPQKDIDELQNFLCSWAEKVQNTTTTYWPDYNVGIVAKKENT